MSGHFVVWRLALNDRDDVLANYVGSTWSALAHAAGTPDGLGGVFPGWTPASRQLVTQVGNGSSNLPNRSGLPPHRYLQFPGGAPTPAQEAFLKPKYWINNLVRPSDPGFGIVALAPAAAISWNAGNRYQALIDQITHGNTSIEVYYIGGKEMS
jgi:hypothetical protein